MVDRSEYVIDHAIAEGMEALLAEVIRKYPILYDKTSKPKNGSTFQERHDAAWHKISDELNLELQSCKSLWSCMKQKFIKHRKRLDNGEPVPVWPTYDMLHKWLDKHVKKRRSRHDYIKQMKLTSRTLTKTEAKDEDDDDDDSRDQDDEWTEIIEDNDTTTVQVKLKRKSDACDADELPLPKTLCGSNRYERKKKFNIEVVSDSGTTVYEDPELFNELDQKAIIKDAEIVVVEESRTKTSTPQIEIIDVKEANVKSSNELDENVLKIERILTNFTHSLERLNFAHTASDSNDAFGKYMASMIREIPVHKRMKVRLNILQYATELIANEISSSNN